MYTKRIKYQMEGVDQSRAWPDTMDEECAVVEEMMLAAFVSVGSRPKTRDVIGDVIGDVILPKRRKCTAPCECVRGRVLEGLNGA